MLVARNRVWSFDVDQLERDVLPAENGKERRFRSTAFPLLFGSLKTVWRFQQRPRDGFHTRHSARRVEPVGRERQLSVLMLAADYTRVGAE